MSPTVGPAQPRQAKGLNLVGLAKMLRHNHMVESLPGLLPGDRTVLSGYVMPGSWYPFESFARILNAVHQQLGKGTEESARDMGRGHAMSMLNGPHAAFLHQGDVPRTLTAFSRIWPQYFNFGTLEFTAEGPRVLHLQVHGYPDMGRSHGTLIVHGWMGRSVELAGGRDVQVKIERAPWLGSGDLHASLGWS